MKSIFCSSIFKVQIGEFSFVAFNSMGMLHQVPSPTRRALALQQAALGISCLVLLSSFSND